MTNALVEPVEPSGAYFIKTQISLNLTAKATSSRDEMPKAESGDRGQGDLQYEGRGLHRFLP
jgi:hypothetical protein